MMLYYLMHRTICVTRGRKSSRASCQSGFHHANAQWSRFSFLTDYVEAIFCNKKEKKLSPLYLLSTKVSYVMMTAGVMFHISPQICERLDDASIPPKMTKKVASFPRLLNVTVESRKQEEIPVNTKCYKMNVHYKYIVT